MNFDLKNRQMQVAFSKLPDRDRISALISRLTDDLNRIKLIQKSLRSDSKATNTATPEIRTSIASLRMAAIKALEPACQLICVKKEYRRTFGAGNNYPNEYFAFPDTNIEIIREELEMEITEHTRIVSLNMSELEKEVIKFYTYWIDSELTRHNQDLKTLFNKVLNDGQNALEECEYSLAK